MYEILDYHWVIALTMAFELMVIPKLEKCMGIMLGVLYYNNVVSDVKLIMNLMVHR